MTKILFLEDEPTIQEVTAEYLKIAGYDVTLVQDGQQAIIELKKEEYDLAVLDIMVPKISGLDVLAMIRKDFPNMGVIMLTALGDEQTQVKAFNLFADDYVTKPFSPILLMKRIETILHRMKDTTRQMDVRDQLIIDQKAYQAFYNGESLLLTVSEFLLLNTLASNPKQVFTREQLIEQIFHEDTCENDRIIDAHVKNLRKKLPIACIKTVIGAGYQYGL